MPSSKPAKVLVVDDDSNIVEIIAQLLSPFDCQIEKAFDGVEAVAKANVSAPDLVITGQMMPRMTGIEAALKILQSHPQCRFIFATSNAANTDFLDQYTAAGFDRRLLLGKPFTRAELFDVLAICGLPQFHKQARG